MNPTPNLTDMVQQHLGALMLQVIQLQAQLAVTQAELASLRAASEKAA